MAPPGYPENGVYIFLFKGEQEGFGPCDFFLFHFLILFNDSNSSFVGRTDHAGIGFQCLETLRSRLGLKAPAAFFSSSSRR